MKIVIIGTGGLAKEMRYLLKEIINSCFDSNDQSSNPEYLKTIFNFLGYIDIDTTKQIHGEKVIGDDDWLISSDSSIGVMFGIGNPLIVKRLSEKYKQNKNLFFPNFIHPKVIGNFSGIRMGEGNIITAGCILSADISIGNFNIFNVHSTIGHDSIIGNCNLINPAVNISGYVTVGDGCFFGVGCQILERLQIANNTIVGGGAVLTKSINIPNSTYVGIPAKQIKQDGFRIKNN
jgi:sugar O-acyltransferase (sialic acid O-acetyltransferase NeuD family)